MLRVDNITVSYGPTRILSDISLNAGDNEILCIIGPNGHGKTTLLKSIAGLNPPISGEIWFNGTRVSGLPVHKIVKHGIVLLAEGGGYLPYLTVLENLKLGGYSDRRHFSIDNAYVVFPWLRERRRQIAWTLSGGERRMLAIARCLTTNSKLLLFDEPTWGLAPRIRNETVEIVRNIRDSGRGLIIAESDAGFVRRVADRVLSLRNNRLTPIEKDSLVVKTAEHLL